MGQHRKLIETKRAEIREVVRGHRGRTVAVFGSVARGDESSSSDIDLLVEFEPGRFLFGLLRITEELEGLLDATPGPECDVASPVRVPRRGAP